MKRMLNKTMLVAGVCVLAVGLCSFRAPAQEPFMVTEKSLALMPCKYVNERIVTEARFLDTSTNLLDDMFNDMMTRFPEKSYINFRTIDHQIMRYFIHLKDADIISTLEEGDRIIITGTVTSCADQRPWVKADSIIRAPSQ